ncbi:serine/threonine-protein kinase [archaeon]|nr:MAG: serine/threonine-protein kinase [archaeon]
MGNCSSICDCLFFKSNSTEYVTVPGEEDYPTVTSRSQPSGQTQSAPEKSKEKASEATPLASANLTHNNNTNAGNGVKTNASSASLANLTEGSEKARQGGSTTTGSTKSPPHGTLKSAFHQHYELREEMGVGSTSKCYRCIRKTDAKEFACKVIDKRHVEIKFSGLLDQFYVELKVLQTLNHPNIIKLIDTFETPDRIYMIMELMKGGELFDYVVEKGTLSEEEASVIIRKITSAVAHMHSMQIIHRDLKPENLLLTTKGADAEIKLIDFGLAKVMFEEVASSFLGTKGYLAPEMLQRQSYDQAIDMWALGVICFVLLCGCLPFDDDSSRITSEQVARKKFTLRFPKWASTLSASAKDLLHNLLEIDPKRRFSAEQALNHPWVAGKTVQRNSYLQSPCILGMVEYIMYVCMYVCMY